MLRSKKFFLVVLIIVLSTILVGVPPLLSAILAMDTITILSGTEYASLLTLIVNGYIAGNVWQKKTDPSTPTE